MAGVVGTVTAIPGTGVVDLNLQSHCARGFRYVSHRALGGRDIGRIDQHGHSNALGTSSCRSPSRLAVTSPAK